MDDVNVIQKCSIYVSLVFTDDYYTLVELKNVFLSPKRRSYPQPSNDRLYVNISKIKLIIHVFFFEN